MDEAQKRENKECIEKIDALVNQYTARRKEIEDSFVECGLEVPLVSRDLNATVNPVGPSFEPVGRDYRMRIEDEATSRMGSSKPQPSSQENYGPSDSDDPAVLKEDLKRMQVRISELDEAIVEAAIADDFDRKNKLEKESRDLRIQREKTIMKIKNLEVPQQKAFNDGYVERIESLEADVRGLRSQISMVRGDINDLKDMVESIMRSLQMDDEDEIQ